MALLFDSRQDDKFNAHNFGLFLKQPNNKSQPESTKEVDNN